MNWDRDSVGWPHREHSEFVEVGAIRWHFQRFANKGKPELLFIHGSGATSHSWAKLIPLLKDHFAILAVDIPGHGFSSPFAPGRPNLPNVARATAQLLQQLNIDPVLVIGHSAGAAIAVQMTAAGEISPKALVSINGAFYPFPGMSGELFPAMARMLFLNPLVPSLFAWGASASGAVPRLIESTGSKLDDDDIEFYSRAINSSDHVEGTLAMMANWDLEPMAAMLRSLDVPVLQIIGMSDGTIEPKAASQTSEKLRFGELVQFPGKGHLIHEEAPRKVADAILEFAKTKLSL